MTANFMPKQRDQRCEINLEQHLALYHVQHGPSWDETSFPRNGWIKETDRQINA